MLSRRIVYLILGGVLIFSLVLAVTVMWMLRPETFENKLEELDQADQIKIFVLIVGEDGFQNVAQHIRTIDDPEQIKLFIAKIRTYSDNWQHRDFSPPITGITGQPAGVQISFFHKGEPQVFLSIGYSDGTPYFLQESLKRQGRYLEYHEFKELMDFLDIEEKAAYHKR